MSPLLDTLRGRPVLVVGLGRSGLAAARRLIAAGAHVTATDSKPESELAREAALLASAGVIMKCGGHDVADFTAASLIVLAPGVPLDRPELQAARAAGVAICSEVDLVAPLVGHRVVAITGSNGKSTTTGLAASMLAAAGREGIACANFGTPFCDAVQGDHPGRWYAAELSSFQLDITHELAAGAVALLNVQEDHIDRHGTFALYRAAKEKIADRRAPGAPVVAVVDDPLVAEFAARVAGPVLEISAERPVARGGFVRGSALWLRVADAEEHLLDIAALPIPGRHNRLNILSAAACCRAVGVPVDALRRGILAFKALPHRLQEVAQVAGVRFIDDSKATNVGSVLEAIAALGESMSPGSRLFVLLGGRDKNSDFRPLAAALDAAGAVAMTFGEAGPLIADVLAREGCAGLHRCGPMEEAIARAHAQARPGDVVLLSPACASFDAFSGMAARGDAFAAAARRFSEEHR